MFSLLEGRCQLEEEQVAGKNVWLTRGEVLTRGEEGAGEIAWLT